LIFEDLQKRLTLYPPYRIVEYQFHSLIKAFVHLYEFHIIYLRTDDNVRGHEIHKSEKAFHQPKRFISYCGDTSFYLQRLAARARILGA